MSNMVLLVASFLVLPMVLASSKITRRSGNCEYTVVDSPRSVLGHSKVHQPPAEKYWTEGIKECMEFCCDGESMCNVGLFLDDSHQHGTNCLLYSCYPLDSCSPNIKKGTAVFIDQPSLDGEDEHYADTTVSPYDEIYPNDQDSETTVSPYDEIYPNDQDSETTVSPYDEIYPSDQDTTVSPYDEIYPDDQDTTVSPYDEIYPDDQDTTVSPYDEIYPDDQDTTVSPYDEVYPDDQDTTVSPYDEIYPDVNDNQGEQEEDDSYDENPPVVYNGDIKEDIGQDIQSSLSPQTVEESVDSQFSPSSDVWLSASSLIDATASLQAAVTATTTNIAPDDEWFQLFGDLETSTAQVLTTSESFLSFSFLDTVSLQPSVTIPSYLFIESLSTIVHDVNDAYLEVANIGDISTTAFGGQLWEVSTPLQSIASQGILEETAVWSSSNTAVFESSYVAMETSSLWPFLESSSAYAEVTGEDDSDSPTASEPLQPTETLTTTTTQATSDYSDDDYTQFNYNQTQLVSFESGKESIEPITAVLICILTVGCVFALAVVGVLGVRVYEGYRKRHYSRLDYLINGMYS